MNDPLPDALILRGIERTFRSGEESLTILHGADLTLSPGEIVALVAPSGTGKSTLLHIAGLLERPDAGTVIVTGQSTIALDDTARTRLRRNTIGFVYQFHHLLGEFTAQENVMLPQLVASRPRAAAAARAADLLGALGLGQRLHHPPGKLSGGEKQRVAIARALANSPRILLADEPTGNLDSTTAEAVFDQLLRVVRNQGVAALIATHNPELAARMDRKVTLRHGGLHPN